MSCWMFRLAAPSPSPQRPHHRGTSHTMSQSTLTHPTPTNSRPPHSWSSRNSPMARSKSLGYMKVLESHLGSLCDRRKMEVWSILCMPSWFPCILAWIWYSLKFSTSCYEFLSFEWLQSIEWYLNYRYQPYIMIRAMWPHPPDCTLCDLIWWTVLYSVWSVVQWFRRLRHLIIDRLFRSSRASGTVSWLGPQLALGQRSRLQLCIRSRLCFIWHLPRILWGLSLSSSASSTFRKS